MKHTSKALTAIASMTLAMTIAAPAFAQSTAPVVPAPVTDNAAVNLRVTLDNLLGEHANLALLAMEDGYTGSPAFTAVATALGNNTNQLAGAIASVYGAQAGAAFQKIWSAHIGFFVDYVEATAKHDKAGQQKALSDLAGYKAQFSQFLASANPNLNASAVAGMLQVHVNELIQTFNDFVNKDYTASWEEYVKSYEHMYMTGDALSGAIVKQFPDKFGNASVDTPAANLRVALDMLLGEHADLAVIAMAKGDIGAPDFTAAATVLGQNTADLTAAITSVYGAKGGAVFNQIWTAHIGFFVNYVVATAKNDSAGQQKALSDLAGYKAQFSSFLAGANPNLNASAVAGLLQTHVNELVGTFNDFAMKDYNGWATGLVTSYNHMFMTGDALSGAIVKQFPSKFLNSTDSYPWQLLQFNVKGNDVVNPMSLLGVDTKSGQESWYVPIWYVMHVLKSYGITSTWNGMNWTLQVPSSLQSNVHIDAAMMGAGPMTVSIDGKTAVNVQGVATWDPYTKQGTTFMPLSSVEQVLTDLGVKSSWSGYTLNLM